MYYDEVKVCPECGEQQILIQWRRTFNVRIIII